ncbi:MAG: OmpA family protein [Elusimicrobia bacterium]|nr:OmpA family protein [Elusimicrobiota bacterium]
MKTTSTLLAGLLLLSAGLCSAADKKGCKGDSLFTRMPGTFVKDCREGAFDNQAFHCGPGKPQAIEGRHLMTRYEAEPKAQAFTGVQVQRNHETAAADLGAKKVFSDARYSCYRLAKDGKEFFAEVDSAWNRGYVIRIVEKSGMKQEVAGNSDIFLKTIRETGHAAVYGIQFDTNRAELKPESAPALEEIVKLMSADPELKIHVVGHTDNVGAMADNMALSQARAAAVVKALSGRGVEAARMKPSGVASLVPVAANRSESGRARNRRVELVEQ